MKITFMSKNLLENILPSIPEDSVIISIRDPESSQEFIMIDEFLNKKKIKSFVMEFEDIPSNKWGKFITEKEGKELIKFIKENRNKNFIVHCHAGFSRSPAVALIVDLIVNFNCCVEEFEKDSDLLKKVKRMEKEKKIFPNWNIFNFLLDLL